VSWVNFRPVHNSPERVAKADSITLSGRTPTAQSYPQKLSTGSAVSRETRRRSVVHPVDTAVDNTTFIGSVSRETNASGFQQRLRTGCGYCPSPMQRSRSAARGCGTWSTQIGRRSRSRCRVGQHVSGGSAWLIVAVRGHPRAVVRRGFFLVPDMRYAGLRAAPISNAESHSLLQPHTDTRIEPRPSVLPRLHLPATSHSAHRASATPAVHPLSPAQPHTLPRLTSCPDSCDATLPSLARQPPTWAL
jgi:hypothetical protein